MLAILVCQVQHKYLFIILILMFVIVFTGFLFIDMVISLMPVI